MTTKKKPSAAAGYGAGAAALGAGGAVAVAGELDGRTKDRAADVLQGRGKGAVDAAEHAAKASQYESWASKIGPNYPYVTHELRTEAAKRAREHRLKAGIGRGGMFGALDDLRAKDLRQAAHEGRMVGRLSGGGLAAVGAMGIAGTAIGRHRWEENKHRRSRGKFASTGVKKSLDWKEQLHARAHDGRFQAGAAGGAGAGLAALSLGANGSKGHLKAATRLLDDAGQHEAAGDAARAKATEAEAHAGKIIREGRTRRGDRKAARGFHAEADRMYEQAGLRTDAARSRVASAARASRRGKASAAVWATTGAAGAGTALYNHHRQQKLAADLKGNTVQKNLSAEEIFSTARAETIGKSAREITTTPRPVQKNLGVDALFDAARGDEVAKGLFSTVSEAAGRVGGATKTAGTAVSGKAKSGFAIAKPKVATGLKTAKTKVNTGVQRTSEAAWSHPGAAAGAAAGGVGAVGGAGYLAGKRNR